MLFIGWLLGVLLVPCIYAQQRRNCLDRVVVGVDYYPEQWPFEEMRADMEAIKHDLGADIIRIGEFMWHELEPADGVFNFTLLDSILLTAEELGLEVMLGVPTATMPAWLYAKSPEVMARGPDSPEGYAGATPAFGGRRQYSFNSQAYAWHAKRMAKQLANRYAARKSVTFWQVDNELGHEGSDLDFSESSLVAWRSWLNANFAGDIARLNADWGTAFWGVTYNSFEEIPLPLWTVPGSPARQNEQFRSNSNPGMLLDFRRFRRDSISAFSDDQVSILREANVFGCVTTNSPGGFWGKAMDHNDIFAKMDFPSYDNYPVWGGSVTPMAPSKVAMMLDTVRGWGAAKDAVGETGWMVAEQLIGAQGHDIIGYTPRPGQVLAWAAAAFLHGAIAMNFFRYRAAVYGQEQFCYGILDHSTPRGTGRKWEEAKRVYHMARSYKELWLAPIQAEVALIYDADNLFAWQAQPQSTMFDFETEAHRLYHPFWRNGVAVDVISSARLLERSHRLGHLPYKVLLLPAPSLISDELVALLERFVAEGAGQGSIWISFRSDLRDKRGQIRRTSSRLATLAGIEIAEIESLNDDGSEPVQYTVQQVRKKWNRFTAKVSVWREGLKVAKGSASQMLWRYTDDFFGGQGYGAISRVLRNETEVVYIGTGIDPDALVELASASLRSTAISCAGVGATPDVEQLVRQDRNGRAWEVTINHGSKAMRSNNGVQLEPYQVDLRIRGPVAITS